MTCGLRQESRQEEGMEEIYRGEWHVGSNRKVDIKREWEEVYRWMTCGLRQEAGQEERGNGKTDIVMNTSAFAQGIGLVVSSPIIALAYTKVNITEKYQNVPPE
jgi:hypothetical protein